jgi:hypothetical protein
VGALEELACAAACCRALMLKKSAMLCVVLLLKIVESKDKVERVGALAESHGAHGTDQQRHLKLEFMKMLEC